MLKKISVLFALMLTGPLMPNTMAQTRMDRFIDSLMVRMTLEEKLGQLNLPVSGDIVTGQAGSSDIGKKVREGQVGGLFNIKGVDKIRAIQEIAVRQSRLRIPLLFGMDVIHGYQTVFPIPLGLTATWDMELVERSARIAATEATAQGINWNFSPMADIARDPRWGRASEGCGEDPYLGSAVTRALVRGYQGKDLSLPGTMMATVKHFALYGAAEAGRDYNTTDMSRVRMYNEYFPPYKAAVDEGVGCVMSSFNEIDGIPATGNRWLLTDVLRRQWKFKGFVVSDYTSINEMTDHGMGDLQQVSALALNAGLDMDMVGEGFLTTLKKSLKEKKVTEARINEACRNILVAKYKLGLFDDPFRYCNAERAATEVFTPAHRKEARDIAAQSFVLLKNQGNLLPLKRKGTIALVGPLADNRENMTGTWSVAADHAKSVSILDGMISLAGPDVRILTARGSNLDYDSLFEERAGMFGKSLRHDTRPADVMIREALNVASQADVIVAALGESAEMSGEASSRADIGIPQAQRDLLNALLKTGKPVVLLLFAGRPMTLSWEQEHVPAILNLWFGGSETGLAAADVLFGDVNPSGKLPSTFPRHVGQIPIYYNHKNTGRPLPEGGWFQKFRSNYLDVPNDPLYPFGFGLSYTNFNYTSPLVSNPTPRGETSITVSTKVTNTGAVAGKEVVQLYIRDKVGSVTRPLKELKAFRKISLAPGETKTVSFEITTRDLKFYDNNLRFDWESGAFDIMIGGNSRDVKTASIEWTK
ncbi:MAG: beta-glucosidase BglX [Chitinophagaceae bacterium]|jgi:beta-glucosidase|nr:beta-glucosidase BglX [Chitinophagaceae bacterium]